MLTDKDLIETDKDEKESADSFLKGIVEFLKWTSTIAAAAVIWISGLDETISGGAEFLIIASVIAVLASLIIAVFTMRQVLRAWETEWAMAIMASRFVLVKKLEAVEPENVKPQQVPDAINEYLDAIDATRAYSRPARYSLWTTLHIGLLIIGLVLYAIGQGIT